MQAPKRQGQRQSRKGSRTPQVVRNRIIDLYRDGANAREIADRLTSEGLDAPHERTVRNIIRRHVATPAAPAEGYWYFADESMPAEDAGIVLQVLAEWRGPGPVMPRPRSYLPRRGTGFPGPSLEQARWIVRLRRAIPDLPASRTLSVAHDLASATTATATTNEDLGQLTGEIERELVRWLTERMADDDQA